MSNQQKFIEQLTKEYEVLFETSREYALAKSRYTPAALAEKMTKGLFHRDADKDGVGVKRTCKALGVKHTYAAIAEYLGA